MHFPSREPGRRLERTLLDGELVIDKDAVDGSLRHRFLVYDACCVDGRNLLSEPLPTRLMVMRREVLAPRFAAAQAGGGGAGYEGEPFVIEPKDFFALPQLPAIGTTFLKRQKALVVAAERAVAKQERAAREALATPQFHACGRPSELLLEERDGPVLSIHDARQLLGIDARRRVAFEQQGCQKREQCAQAQRQGDARQPRIGAAAPHESRSHFVCRRRAGWGKAVRVGRAAFI